MTWQLSASPQLNHDETRLLEFENQIHVMCHLVVYKTAPLSRSILQCLFVSQLDYRVAMRFPYKKKRERKYSQGTTTPTLRLCLVRRGDTSCPVRPPFSPFHNFVMHISKAVTTIVLSSMGIAVKIHFFIMICQPSRVHTSYLPFGARMDRLPSTTIEQ